jgi:hypothetical protein
MLMTATVVVRRICRIEAWTKDLTRDTEKDREEGEDDKGDPKRRRRGGGVVGIGKILEVGSTESGGGVDAAFTGVKNGRAIADGRQTFPKHRSLTPHTRPTSQSQSEKAGEISVQHAAL